MQGEHNTMSDCNRNLQDITISIKTLRDDIHAKLNSDNLEKYFQLTRDLSEFSSLYNPPLNRIKGFYDQNAGNFLKQLELIDSETETTANEYLKLEMEAKKLDVNNVINQCLGMVEELVNTNCVINSMGETNKLMVIIRKERIAFVKRLTAFTRSAYYSVKLMMLIRRPNRRLRRQYKLNKNQFQILTMKVEERNFESELDTVAAKIEKFASEWIEPLLESYGMVGELGKEKTLKTLENA
ncbi:unnamed protein product [Orchesella dallaii]|uniref:Uncharacterized protein n=1 Tax=Orchesella dallaii TaxID=48710 RepID=A0ABP1QT79_9HEXA